LTRAIRRLACIVVATLMVSPMAAAEASASTAVASDSATSADAAIDAAVMKSVARQVLDQYRLTPEKKRALSDLAKEQKAALAPHMKSMQQAAEAFAKDPKVKADMERMANDMKGVMARQLPQLLAALQPMLQEALPAMLEAQAKALRMMTTPTPVDPYEDE
jgi:hypothetical protein